MSKNENIVEPDVNTMGATVGEIISGGGQLVQSKTTYTTAVHVQLPRDLVEVEKACISEARLAGEAVFYGWMAGTTHIEGPSIECAMIALRNWGNCACEVFRVETLLDSWVMHAGFVDCQTGVTYVRPFRMDKRSIVAGKADEIRKMDIRFQIGASKAARNVIIRALPGWLIDKMIDAGKEGATERMDEAIKTKGLDWVRQGAVGHLAKYGVKLDRIEAKIGKPIGAWDTRILVLLSADIRILKDGIENSDTLFPPVEDPDAPKGPTNLKEKVKREANGGEAKPLDADMIAVIQDLRVMRAELLVEFDSGATTNYTRDLAIEIKNTMESDLTVEQFQEKLSYFKGMQEKPETSDDKPEPAAAQPEAEAPPKDEPQANRLNDLMSLKKPELLNEAMRVMQVAMDCGAIEDQFADFSDSGGVSPFCTEMLTEGILKDGDVTSNANNKGHLARFTARLDGLVADKQPSKSDQQKLPY